MKLNELTIKSPRRLTFKDVEGYLKDFYRPRNKTRVKTNLPGIELAVQRHGGDEFTVFILDDSKPVGFVEFMGPNLPPSRLNFSDNVFTPHVGMLKDYAGRGYPTAVYRWFLDSGHILVTGNEQTEGGNALWRSLSKSYPLRFIDSKGELHPMVSPELAQKPSTRMALFGKGQSPDEIYTEGLADRLFGSEGKAKASFRAIADEAQKTFGLECNIFRANTNVVKSPTMALLVWEDNEEPDVELLKALWPAWLKRTFETKFPDLGEFEVDRPQVKSMVAKHGDYQRALFARVTLKPYSVQIR